MSGPGVAQPPWQYIALPQVDTRAVARARVLLHGRAGLVLGDHKEDMVARTVALQARQAASPTVDAYLDALERDRDHPQWAAFVNAFTINHTAFFRERHHFDILCDFVRARRRPISVWSSAAATGEEPYSIAMSLLSVCDQRSAGLSVLATDIDTDALAYARRGIYPLERVAPIPKDYLRRYCLLGTGSHSGMARMKADISGLVDFQPLNLVAPHWPITKKFDAIFCRNTMIYFDKEAQTRLLSRFAGMLKPDGLLFVGHSENFTYLTERFRLRGQTVYERV